MMLAMENVVAIILKWKCNNSGGLLSWKQHDGGVKQRHSLFSTVVSSEEKVMSFNLVDSAPARAPGNVESWRQPLCMTL